MLLNAARASKTTVVRVMVGFRPGHPEISARNRIFSAIKAHGMLLFEQSARAIHEGVAPQRDEAVVICCRSRARYHVDQIRRGWASTP